MCCSFRLYRTNFNRYFIGFYRQNDMIKKDKKPWQMETAEWRFYGNN